LNHLNLNDAEKLYEFFKIDYRSTVEMEQEVKEAIRILGPTGYTLRPSHTILRNTPIENIMALYEAANKYRTVL